MSKFWEGGVPACCVPLAGPDLGEPEAAGLAVLFRALGDPVRLRLLNLIATAEAGEACVCDLTAAFTLSAPTISHHLKVLREAGLITGERRGTWIYYRAAGETLARLAAVLAAPAPAPATTPAPAPA